MHPAKLDDSHVIAFLEFLALKRNVSHSTQATALNALSYLYLKFLGRQRMEVGDFARARKQRKLPVVLTREEVSRLLEQLQVPYRTCAELMYGSGLRLMEVCRLRVKAWTPTALR